jgi:soluble lytic murein transglycosylase
LTAIIITESSFNKRARSNRGALGLMQIRPATGKQLATEVSVQWRGAPSLYDPETNIALGAYYLNKLFLRFGDLGLALEAYNHGPSRLKGYLKNLSGVTF